ncbi:hypothetical protein CEXT_117421 [Caerostris extrusa]|uniref:Uncharacterized protein n=1 Tax=Caerostris extrusa TaxID=172846 RepID=A0AAV4P3M2_CAEEX|nr:hypothetical protein CEXT_117421 [Caerostris extrusa]
MTHRIHNILKPGKSCRREKEEKTPFVKANTERTDEGSFILKQGPGKKKTLLKTFNQSRFKDIGFLFAEEEIFGEVVVCLSAKSKQGDSSRQ